MQLFAPPPQLIGNSGSRDQNELKIQEASCLLQRSFQNSWLALYKPGIPNVDVQCFTVGSTVE